VKHGKRPTVRQKQFISSKNLNPDNWLVTKDCTEVFEIVNRVGGKVRSYKKVN